MQQARTTRRMLWSRIRTWAEEEWSNLAAQADHRFRQLGGVWVKVANPIASVLGLMLSYHVLNLAIQGIDPMAGTLDLGVLSILGFAVLVSILGARLITLIWDGWSNQEKGGTSWHYLAYEKGSKTLMWLAYLLWLAWLL